MRRAARLYEVALRQVRDGEEFFDARGRRCCACGEYHRLTGNRLVVVQNDGWTRCGFTLWVERGARVCIPLDTPVFRTAGVSPATGDKSRRDAGGTGNKSRRDAGGTTERKVHADRNRTG